MSMWLIRLTRAFTGLNSRNSIVAAICFAPVLLSMGPGKNDFLIRTGIYASKEGAFGAFVRFTDDCHHARKVNALAQFVVAGDGALHAKWRTSLAHLPRRVYVSDYGWVVGVDDEFRAGYAHAVTIWNRNGELLADYRLEELLSEQHIAAHANCVGAQRYWLEPDAKVLFVEYWRGIIPSESVRFHLLVIIFPWDHTLTFDLLTGELLRGFAVPDYEGRATARWEKAVQEYREIRNRSAP